MKNRTFKKAVSAFLCALLIFSSVAVGASAVDFTAPEDMYLISKTDSRIAPGVMESKVVTNGKDGDSQVMGYAVEVDAKNPTTGLAAGYNNYDGTNWAMQTVRNQAAAIEKKRGVNVVAAFNADIFNMSTGEPTGCLVMNGRAYKDGIGRPYFAVMKDGTYKIGSSMTQEILNNCTEAVSGFFTLLENGQRTAMGMDDKGLVPKTAVGIKADGNVILYCADGRNYPVSVGLTNKKLCDIMIGLGCVDVLNLDGGGSTTYAAKYEGNSTLEVANNPSDGIERVVSSSLFVLSSAKPTGEFDHASMLPNNELYTPKSTVQFSAKGVDSAGSAADLPADGKFVLAAESAALGTITDDGLFTSNGTVGKVKVNYVSGGKDCGSTSIEIQKPDRIYFESDEVSLGFDKESNLGLAVKYKDRVVNYKDGDIIWSMDDEKMGTFNGNLFTSSDSETITGKIYAVSAFDSSVSGEVTAVIGKLPSVIWDFENPDDYVFTTSLKNPDAENATMLINGYGRGAQGSAEVITKEEGEVRIGTHALKIDYDLSNWNMNTDGICIGPTKTTDYIEGTPTGIGMWVYAPEGTPNFWLRMYYYDANGQNQQANFTVQRKEATDGIGGINWTGWKYVEAEIKGVAPFRFFAGQTIRLMALSPAGNEHGLWTVTGGYEKDENGNDTPILNKKRIDKAEAHGSIYVDNVQFTYGANKDDIDNPIIDNVKIGSKDGSDMVDISGDTTVETNDICIESSFHDVQNKYTTDINFDSVNVYIDGKDVTADSYILKGDYMVKYYGTLADGLHSVKILVRDGFNNETTETRYFTVKGGVEYPTVSLTAQTDKCLLNQDFALKLTSNEVDKIAGVKTKIRLDKTIVDESTLKIEFAEGFNGTYSYSKANGNLILDVSGSAEGSTNQIATITTKIPYNTLEGRKFTYRVLEGNIEFTDSSILTTTFSTANMSVPIEAAYVTTVDGTIVGGGNSKIYVKDASQAPVEGVGVYNASDNSLIGTTDENGEVETDIFSSSVQKISIYAMKDGNYSFKCSTQSVKAACNENGEPQYVLINASQNGSNAKNISWLSNPLASKDESYVRFALKDDYEQRGDEAFTEVKGTNKLYSFLGSSNIEQNYIARINTVKLEGLKGNSEYVYSVGDGQKWSNVKPFSTALANGDTNFFVFGDIQAEDTTKISNLMSAVANDGVDYDLGIQTGDSIETANIYSHWDDILKVFSNDNISDIDLLHVLGNHEFMGDPQADSSVLIYNLQNKDFYSLDYGNVHISVINYAAIESNLDTALKWLEKDAGSSNAIWKIVTLHVPPYNTNISDSHKAFTEKFPKVAQKAGVDFVFSGHDHSYARTAPMTDMKVDEENGVTYFICGSSGEKSYGVTINPDYNFKIATNEFSSIYLSVNATDSQFTVNTYDVNGDSKTLLDSFTKHKKNDCSVNGHIFKYENGYLSCTACGMTRKLGTYTGFARDVETGRNMYFLGGQKKTGWFQLENDAYYFDENGLGLVGEHKIGEVKGTFRFDNDGRQIGAVFEKFDGGTRAFRGSNTSVLVGWHEIEGNLYYFSRSNGAMRTGRATVTVRTGQKLDYVFSKDGKLQRGAFYETADGTVYYWGSEMVGGWQEIDGDKYYFDPETHIMADDTTEIDGKLYAFNQQGVLVHEGAHNWVDKVTVIKKSCTVDGQDRYTCSICKSHKFETVKATGHVDNNGDGVCDECHFKMDFNSQTNNFLYRFFQRILFIFRLIGMKIKGIFKK